MKRRRASKRRNPGKILRLSQLTKKAIPGHAPQMARVLIVDDHADSREAILRMLQRDGYQVDSAAEGREALNSIIYKTPDVVLLDLALPEIDGVKLVQLLRTYHRLSSIPVIILTGLNSGRLFEEAQSLNVSALLLKSVATIEQIRAALQKALTPPSPNARMQSAEKWRGDTISPL
jgi:CheY-like chemotaxis protein